jgi:hypothetical protein
MCEPERKRRGPITLFCESRRFRWTVIAAAVLTPGLYVASFGPACWISSRANSQALPAAYLPIGWLLKNSPQPIATALVEYAQAGMPPGSLISVPVSDGLPSLILN